MENTPLIVITISENFRRKRREFQYNPTEGRTMNPETLYMWFKLYRNIIDSQTAQWDFLNHVRKEIQLSPKDELFYRRYAKEHGISIGENCKEK